MEIFSRIQSLAKNFFGKERIERDLDEEVRGYVELLAAEKIKSGLNAKEARRQAMIEMAGTEQVKEQVREARVGAFFETLVQDVRYGLRQLRRSPGFAVVAILTLAIGIGANTAIFTLLDAILLRRLPVQDPEQLYQVRRTGTDAPERLTGDFTNPLWENLRERQDVFSGMAAWGNTEFNLSQGGAVERAEGLWVSGGYFDTLEVRPALGRLITHDDDSRGCPGIAVLSYGFWQEHYSGAASLVGSTITLDSHPFEVVGVTEPGFYGVDVGTKFDVAAPFCATVLLDGVSNSRLDDRSSWWFSIVGRAKPGLSPQQMNARLAAIAPAVFASSLPEDWSPDLKKRFLKTGLAAVPAASGVSLDLREQFRKPLTVLMAVVGLVLLIACANVAALMLARAAAQSREFAVRLALGANRLRLVRQLLTHALIISLAGAAAGVLLAHGGTKLLVRSISTRGNAVFLDLTPDWRILGFTALAALATAAVFGILPALRSARLPLQGTMRGATYSQTEPRSPLRKWIVASQIALSLVLLVTAGLFLRSFANLVSRSPGFDQQNVLLVTSDLGSTSIKPDRYLATLDEVQARLSQLPGVVAVGRSEDLPLSGRYSANYVDADAPHAPAGDNSVSYMIYNSPGYFAAMRMAVLAGRDFTISDMKNSLAVAVVNQAFARKFFSSLDPIGRAIHVGMSGKPGPPVQIVGIVADSDYRSLRDAMPATVYFPLAQHPEREGQDIFEIRTAVRPAGLMGPVEKAVAGVSREIPLEFNTLEQLLGDSMVEERLLAMLSGFFGAVALLLAMIGLYGTISYRVTLRRGEFGIRMARGAVAFFAWSFARWRSSLLRAKLPASESRWSPRARFGNCSSASGRVTRQPCWRRRCCWRAWRFLPATCPRAEPHVPIPWPP